MPFCLVCLMVIPAIFIFNNKNHLQINHLHLCTSTSTSTIKTSTSTSTNKTSTNTSTNKTSTNKTSTNKTRSSPRKHQSLLLEVTRQGFLTKLKLFLKFQIKFLMTTALEARPFYKCNKKGFSVIKRSSLTGKVVKNWDLKMWQCLTQKFVAHTTIDDAWNNSIKILGNCSLQFSKLVLYINSKSRGC